MVTVFLSLGSNAGKRHRNMEEMVARLTAVLAPPVKISRLMETEPVEVAERQQWYLNRIMSGSFGHSAQDLLHECGRIENALGRVRTHRHSPRTADIDILIFGDAVIHEHALSIPHPGLLGRRFCLEGIREIAPDLTIPGVGVRVGAWYEAASETIKAQKVMFIGQ
jgi:2-amino-4-hydroxy-6-hydroxymethyldihydropteridine diphosphokinase